MHFDTEIKLPNKYTYSSICWVNKCSMFKKKIGEGEIRTLVSLRPTAFRERPVMTTSVPLQKSNHVLKNKYLFYLSGRKLMAEEISGVAADDDNQRRYDNML